MRIVSGAFAATFFLSATAASALVPFDVRYESEAVGLQHTTATFSVGGVETFTGAPSLTGFTTDFGTGGAITGTYSGNTEIRNADQYGGAGGSGPYAVTFSSSGYTLDLSSSIPGGVNYFGYWLSALDKGNTVSFYSGTTLLFTFQPQDVIDEVNRHPDAASYYGNPNAPYLGQNSSEPYIFLNFFYDTGSFTKVVFAENPQIGGYESDNHTVGHFLTKGTGTSVPLINSAVPEPATWGLMLAGFAMVGAAARRRQNVVAA